ncbi:SRPBCC family protein [Wenyingzhuangia aestuarii]|uniref:SRPBCC family protein n=1 Tax=Wenyingzhuangia aestuarii TaxID=1647582 RepID=UPI00143BDA41|nr:SRPBCC family protein [Wenyingzhuangia aestuarii]NJB83930.1 putative membrane protein [Wenyingzhuangia aestuarii]
MKKFFLYGSVVIIVAIIIVGIMAPKETTVQRSVVIEKPVDVVFDYFLSLQNMEEYSPWQARDPKTVHEYRGAGNTVGSVHRWVSTHKEVGTGEQEITDIKQNKEIISELRFEEPFESTSQGFLKFKSVPNGTEVIWGYNGNLGFLESIFMMFVDMDKILGDDFTKGLTTAKSNLEN